MYVCDRFIVPGLSEAERGLLRTGDLSLDLMTKEYIAANFTYRFVTARDGNEAGLLERRIRSGGLGGKPLLNPLPDSTLPAGRNPWTHQLMFSGSSG